MRSWFGKTGNGMHVSCVIMKGNFDPDQREEPLDEAHEVKFKKRTYITFIGKATQDVGSVIAIYQSLLSQLQTNFPYIKYIIDKSDNADCYHNEVLFTWKAIWPQKTLNISFVDTIFNEQQSGKDQCDRDNATAKCQMQYYIERRNNIATPDQMYDAMYKATSLSGFTANMLDIAEKKLYPKTKKIQNISRIHHVRYNYSEAKTKFHVWQYSSIGPRNKFDVPIKPNTPKFEEKVKFNDGGEKFGFVSEKRKNSASLSDDLPCTEEACALTFPSFAKLQHHLDFGHHHYEDKNATQLATVPDEWIKRFEGTIEQRCSSYNNTANGEHSKSNLLQMG